MSNNNMR